MKIGQWVAAENIKTEGQLNAIRDAVRDLGFQCSDHYGAWMTYEGNDIAANRFNALLLSDNGNLVWTHDKLPTRDRVTFRTVRTAEFVPCREYCVLNVSNTTLPKPESEPPLVGAKYYIPSLVSSKHLDVSLFTWYGGPFDTYALKYGLVHLEKQAAEEWSMFLISLSKETRK